MAFPDVPHLPDGATATAAAMNSALGSLEDAVNAVEAAAISPNGVHHQHLPTFVPVAESANVDTAGAGHTYNFTTTPPAAAVVIASGGSNLEIDFNATLGAPVTIGSGAGVNPTILIITANVHVWDIRDSVSPNSLIHQDNIALFELEWYNGTVWAAVPQSRAPWSQDNVGRPAYLLGVAAGIGLPLQQADVALLGALVAGDLGGDAVYAVRGTVRAVDGANANWTNRQIVLRECSLQAMGLYSGV